MQYLASFFAAIDKSFRHFPGMLLIILGKSGKCGKIPAESCDADTMVDSGNRKYSLLCHCVNVPGSDEFTGEIRNS